MEFLLLFLKLPRIEDQDHKGFHYSLNDIHEVGWNYFSDELTRKLSGFTCIGFLNNSIYFCIKSTLLFSKKFGLTGSCVR